MVTSTRAQAKRDLPRLLLPVPLFLWWALVYPCFHRRPSNTSRYFGISLLWGYCSFFLSLGAHNFFSFFWCPPSLESLFSSVLWNCDQIPLAFKVRFPGDSQCLCQIPRLGSLTWGSEPSQHWRTSLVLFFYFVGHPPGGNEISFYCDCAPPTILLRLLCLWTWVSFFDRFQCLLSMVA